MENPPRKAEKIYPAVITAAVFVFFFSPPHNDGTWVLWGILWAFPVLTGIFFHLVFATFHAKARKNCAIRVGIWLFAFALVFGFHAFREMTTRPRADGIVAEEGVLFPPQWLRFETPAFRPGFQTGVGFTMKVRLMNTS
ncbi:MAG: hypothetical protein LBD06_04630 [Candidatus Accumulibacter sp.]|nr:hypothetical protein [Accumulibacter sp.]